MGAPSRIAFDPREQRVVSDLARWMGLLGRFQIVAATFIFIVLLAVAAIATTAEVLEPAGGAAGQGPIISMGEVSRAAIAAVVAAVVAFSIVFFRGGMLLVSAAEDLDGSSANEEKAGESFDSALRRIRAYFVLESMLMTGIVAAVYAATILRWPGL